jgi:hypothetical protein
MFRDKGEIKKTEQRLLGKTSIMELDDSIHNYILSSFTSPLACLNGIRADLETHNLNSS